MMNNKLTQLQLELSQFGASQKPHQKPYIEVDFVHDVYMSVPKAIYNQWCDVVRYRLNMIGSTSSTALIW